MDWEYVRIWGLILVMEALGVALLWGLGYAVYLNRVGSRGWASTRRLLTSSFLVFSLTLPVVLIVKEGPALWALLRGGLGSAEGRYQTGLLYQVGGTFLRPNQWKALDLFRRSAEQGHAQAQFALAWATWYGRGIPKNPPEALHWARAAAQAGHPLAMVLAGDILQDSRPDEAASYYRQAAPLLRTQGGAGDAGACFALGSLYRRGLGVEPDPVEALAWMLLAQRLGLGPLQSHAAQTYEQLLNPDQRIQARAKTEALQRAHGRIGAGN